MRVTQAGAYTTWRGRFQADWSGSAGLMFSLEAPCEQHQQLLSQSLRSDCIRNPCHDCF